jgi:DNA-binding CsgD family transcriptional regulator
MDALPVPWLDRYRYEPIGIALAYRWATLIVGLLIALFAEESLQGSSRIALLGPVAAAAMVSALALRSPSSRWVTAALVGEVAVAAVAIAITGLHDSPLRLYLTAPVVHAAIMRSAWLVFGLLSVAVALFVGLVSVDPESRFRPGATIRDIALFVMLPVLVLTVAGAAARHGRGRPNLDIQTDDLAVAAELVRGKTYREIAMTLDMSPETVKVAVARLYRRLGARSRGEAVQLIHDFALLDRAASGAAPRRDP